MKLLDYDLCPPELLDEINIPAADFQALFDLNLFLDLNQSLGTLIDDFEDDGIVGRKKLIKGRAICQNYVEAHPDMSILPKLRDLFDLAISQNTGVFF